MLHDQIFSDGFGNILNSNMLLTSYIKSTDIVHEAIGIWSSEKVLALMP